MATSPGQSALETAGDSHRVDPDAIAVWQCKECGTSQPDDRDGTQFCASCGRPRIDVEWSQRIKRLGLILFGIGIQAMTGIMIFLVPPGASAWAWVIYLGVGLIGFLHMFIGIELTRRDAREQRTAVDALHDDAAGLPSQRATGGDALGEELPLHTRRCPACDHSLIQTIDRGRRRCPGCGGQFNLRQLGFHRDDPAGELHAASPHEARLSGGVLVTTVLAFAIVTGLILTTLLALSGTGSTPGP